ncbi:MAG: S8 family serine peptidase [Bdellovibrio sp.]|nr:S8 family serine peptidase [Bdellovibrio sp.]
MKKIFVITLCLVGYQSFAVEGLQHQSLRWGLKNSGQTIGIDLNPLQTYRMLGVAGQDIDISTLPKKVNPKKIKVAILDTGIDYSHPELSSLIYQNAPKCAAFNTYRKCIQDGTDETQCRTDALQSPANVYPADCLGWSILDKGLAPTPSNIIGSPDFADTVGHGTHVAGIIASVTNDIEIIPVQVIGDAPNQPIKPYSVDLSPSENVRNGYSNAGNLSERIARGIIYAMNSGAQVINLSLGWPEDQDSDVMKDAISEAERRGIIIVAAAGNDSTSALLRPCQYKGVICVAAHRPDGALASFSNFGYGVDIAAPGTEILSTIPMHIRSKRMPGFIGYDYLSGTSQATPFVTGAVAEMLSRGVLPKDIYPRLILGARAIGQETNVIEGPANTAGRVVNSKSAYVKNILSGLLDIKNAMTVSEQTLILPADKDAQSIIWDRKSLDLNFTFKLKNFWKASKDQIKIEIKPTQADSIYPGVVSLEGSDIKSWGSLEEKTLKVNLRIRDQKQAYLSRMPSELAYLVTVKINGKVHRQFEVNAEVIVSVSKTMQDPEISRIATISRPQNMSFSLVDEVYDNRQAARDYLVVGPDMRNKKSVNLAMNKFMNGAYQMTAIQNLKFDGAFDLAVLQQKIRLDIDQDGRSEYIVRFLEYPDQDGLQSRRGEYIDHFYIFDENMNLKKYFKYNDYHVLMPPKPQWMKVGNELRPAWVGKGQEVRKVWSPLDLLGQTEPGQVMQTPMDIRFYYLDKDFALNQVANVGDGRIVDIIQPDIQSVQQGLVSVLVAKNLGTEIKPSYSNNFYVGQVSNGQVAIDRSFTALNINRNLIDTYKDNTLNLGSSSSETRGTMWYGIEAHQSQRVTMLDLGERKVTDKVMSSQRAIFDTALAVHSGFQSGRRAGVFLVTNSELEYHDMLSNQVATRSLDRYSFYGSDVFIQLQFPITVVDSKYPGEKLPAVFRTEGSRLSRGHKFSVPVMSQNGLEQKIVVPAKLRLKAEKGCTALDAPVYLGKDSGYAMDYYCGDQILRVLLNY